MRAREETKQGTTSGGYNKQEGLKKVYKQQKEGNKGKENKDNKAKPNATNYKVSVKPVQAVSASKPKDKPN